MTRYILRVSSFAGTVPGATHFRGRVEGELARSCHGGTHFNAPEHRGVTTCDEGHLIPGRVSWEVEDRWSEERLDRLAAGGYKASGPAQFGDALAVIRAAISRFSGLWSVRRYLDEDGVVTGEPGDELWYGQIGRELGEYGPTDPYGLILWRASDRSAVQWEDGAPFPVMDGDVAATWKQLATHGIGKQDW
jgi:hypothetical protein